MMIVAGGLYQELCERPLWSGLYGSGGRAAAALAALSPGITLRTYLAQAIEPAHVLKLGVSVIPEPSASAVAFAYFHPLSRPIVVRSSEAMPLEKPLKADGEVVLRFGFIEGEAIVRAIRGLRSTNSRQPGSFSFKWLTRGQTCRRPE